MRKFILLAVAMMGLSSIAASPSMAQPQLHFGVGPDGRPEFGVRDPAQERYERRERWRERRDAERARAYEEGRRDVLREGRRYGTYEERCRNITIQEENEWGRTVTRRIRRCD
jgi:hypothetical protein